MTKVLHLFYVAVAVVFAAAPAVSMAVEQDSAKSGAIVVTDSVSVKVTVVDIKKKERKLTLRDESGAEFVVIAGDEVRNFAQIKKGDIWRIASCANCHVHLGWRFQSDTDYFHGLIVDRLISVGPVKN